MSAKQFSTNMTDQFNNLKKEYSVSLLDYLVTKSFNSLYSHEEYIRNLYISQHPDFSHENDSTIVRCFEDDNIVNTEIPWNLEMIAKVEELILEFGLEVYRYGFSCCMDQLNRIEEEHCFEFGPDEYEDEYDEDEYDYEEYDFEPLHYL